MHKWEGDWGARDETNEKAGTLPGRRGKTVGEILGSRVCSSGDSTTNKLIRKVGDVFSGQEGKGERCEGRFHSGEEVVSLV